MGKSLVIVESPAKAKTINKFLGKDFAVKASMGHVRDLPKRELGVDEDDFTPTYTALPEKKKTLAELKKAAKNADAIYLAADPDREGEAICWHLQEELKKSTDSEFYRVLFNEITERAVRAAFDAPRPIDRHKVDAQQARRILDRLVGYKISPLLWDKVRRGLSAGRVQSVALRIICDREQEIRAFVSDEYWSLTAELEGDEPPRFSARLHRIDGEKASLAGKDAVERALAEIGWRLGRVTPVEDGPDGAVKVEATPGDGSLPFVVSELQARQRKKQPAPPFITSKLQQDSARKLGYSVSRTMRLAQGLYEGREIGDAGVVGLITYMRTDSTRVSDEAVQAVRGFIGETYGAEALPAEPRQFKVGKAAQEAHEAIRPTSLEYTPEVVKPFLGRDELRLYTLIWNRFVASQMEPAIFDTTRADISAGKLTFRATGQVLRSPGWLAVYQESKEAQPQQREDEAEPESDEDRRLPALAKDQTLQLHGLLPRQHFTQPPPRFSEASLVKELEENGIGRPSTYATIISTITNREYVEKEGRRLQPTELGMLVNELMVTSFGDIVDVGYTARLENQLDEIEEGDLDWLDALRSFQKKFIVDLERARKEMRDVKREAIPTDQKCDKCGEMMVIKWGRFGQFLACSGYPDCKNTRELAGDDEGDGDRAAAPKIEEGADPCERCGSPMVLRRGRYGPFLACSSYPDCKTTRKVTVDKEGRAEAKPDVLLDDPCPKCGERLARKQGRFGEFVACSDYPKCRYVRMKETGVSCPDCSGGTIVERRSKRGKVFYGCDRYPDCNFVLWKKPVPKTCPQCDRPYLLERVTKRFGHQNLCDGENCDFSETVEQAVGS